jgi:hypothetical protein
MYFQSLYYRLISYIFSKEMEEARIVDIEKICLKKHKIIMVITLS